MTHTSQHDTDESPHDTPTTLPAFVARFPTEEACADYLFAVRWPDGFVCPKCGDRTAWKRDAGQLYECKNGHVTSVTAGTILHRTKVPLTTWFYGAYLVATLTPGISALQFQKQLGIKRYETAYQLLHKLRAALVAPDREKLHGTVEIDEAFIGGREEGGKRGRGTDKALVVLAVEIVEYDAPDPFAPNDPNRAVRKTRAGRLRAAVIPDASAETLVPWVAANVEAGSVVRTDGWRAYAGLQTAGYTLQQVAQSERGKKTGRYLPMVHLLISNLKRWLLGTYKGAVSEKHLQAYLNEFVFRFNRRFWRGPAFIRALGLSVEAKKRPEYRTLYASRKLREGKVAWVHPNPRRDVPDVDALVEAVWSAMLADLDPEARAWALSRETTTKAGVRAAIEAKMGGK